MQKEQRKAATETLEMMWGQLPLLQGENQGTKRKNLRNLTVYFTES